MKKTSIIFSAFVCIISFTFFSVSCVSNKKEVLFGCDSVNVKFASNIKSILANNCDRCHSTANGATFGSGIIMDNYNEILVFVDTSMGGDGGVILRNVQHAAGANPMPKGGKISDCEIAQIAKWIKDGAPNN